MVFANYSVGDEPLLEVTSRQDTSSQGHQNNPGFDTLLSKDNNFLGMMNQYVYINPNLTFIKSLLPYKVLKFLQTHFYKNKNLIKIDLATTSVLQDERINKPPPSVGRQVKIILNNGTIEFHYANYMHTIEGLEIQSLDSDDEIITLLGKNGQIWIIHKNKLSYYFLNSAIPVFKANRVAGVQDSDTIHLLRTPELQRLKSDDFQRRYGQLPTESQLGLLYLDEQSKPVPLAQSLIERELQEVTTGDIAIQGTRQGSRTDGIEIQHIESREEAFALVSAQAKLVFLLTSILNGRNPQAILQNITQESADQLRSFLSQNESSLGPLFDEISSLNEDNSRLLHILRSVNPEALDKLLEELQIFLKYQRQSYSSKEWEDISKAFESLKQNRLQEIEQAKVASSFKNKLRTITESLKQKASQILQYEITPPDLRKLTSVLRSMTKLNTAEEVAKVPMIAISSVLAIMVGAEIWQYATEGLSSASNFFTNNTIASLGPSYLNHVPKAYFALTCITTGIIMIGAMAAKSINQTTAKTLAKVGAFISGTLVGTMSWAIIDGLRQKNLPLAIEGLGARNFYQGLQLPWANKEMREKKRETLLEKIARKKRVSTAALLLAYGMVSDENRLDPSLLLSVELSKMSVKESAEDGNQLGNSGRAEAIESLETNDVTPELAPFILKNFELFTRELKDSDYLQDLLSKKELWQLTPHEFLNLRLEAQLIVDHLNTKMKSPLFAAKVKFSKIRHWLMENTILTIFKPGNFPNLMYSQKMRGWLINSFIEDFVSRAWFKQYWVDMMSAPLFYIFSPFGSSSFGNPQNFDPNSSTLDFDKMAANPDGPLGVNPKVLADFFIQTYYYFANGIMQALLIFGSPDLPASNQYKTRVESRMVHLNVSGDPDPPPQLRESFRKSLINYLSGVLDLGRMNYHEALLKRILRVHQTLEVTYISGILTRLPAGISAQTSLLAQTYHNLFSFWNFAFIWLLLQQSLNRHEDFLSTHYIDLVNDLSKLDKALRVGRIEEALEVSGRIITGMPNEWAFFGVSREELIRQNKELAAHPDSLKEFIQRGFDILEKIQDHPHLKAAPHKSLMGGLLFIGSVATTVIAVNIAGYMYDFSSSNIPNWIADYVALNLFFYTTLKWASENFDNWKTTFKESVFEPFLRYKNGGPRVPPEAPPEMDKPKDQFTTSSVIGDPRSMKDTDPGAAVNKHQCNVILAN